MSTSQPTYRLIGSADIPALFAVRIATWHNENGAEELMQFGITHASVREMIKTTHQGWLCEVAGEVVGFAMGNKVNGEMWVIAVLKEYEGRGIGRTLLARVEDWLFDQGNDDIWLTTDPDENYRAVGFYRCCGWRDWKMDGDRFMKKANPEVSG